MQDAANLLIGIIIIFSLVALSGLILLRSRRSRNTGGQIDRQDVSQPPSEPATEQEGKFAFLGRIFGLFRRKKAATEAEEWGPQVTEALEAMEAISSIETPGDQGESDLLDAASTSADEELSEAEAEVFMGITNPDGSDEGLATGEGGSEDSGEPADGEMWEQRNKRIIEQILVLKMLKEQNRADGLEAPEGELILARARLIVRKRRLRQQS